MKKGKDITSRQMPNLLDKVYGSTDVAVVEKLAEYGHPGAKRLLVAAMTAEKSKNRNQRARLQFLVQKEMKSFLKAFDNEYTPSDNMVAFFLGIETELLLCKYFGIKSEFAKKCMKKSVAGYEAIANSLDDSVTLELGYETAFTDEYISKWKVLILHLGSALDKLMFFNEPVFNHVTLNNELTRLESELEVQEIDSRKWLQDEFYLFSLAELKLKQLKELFLKSFKKYPDGYKGTQIYTKATITKLEKALFIHKQLIMEG